MINIQLVKVSRFGNILSKLINFSRLFKNLAIFIFIQHIVSLIVEFLFSMLPQVLMVLSF
jgi:hypothetical protein